MKNASVLTGALWGCVCAHTWAADAYPNRSVRFIVPYTPGAINDFVARLTAQKLTDAWGRQVVVDNRPGAAGVIGADLVAKSPPDGYTIYLGGVTTLVVSTYTHKNRPYDDMRDFQPVTTLASAQYVLVLHASVAATTLKEFVAAAKAIFCASLSFPANIIPDNVPVRNVAIGTINSKNFWSIGDIAFSGCVTKMIEYKTTKTIPVNVNARHIPIKNLKRDISSASVYLLTSGLGFNNHSLNNSYIIYILFQSSLL